MAEATIEALALPEDFAKGKRSHKIKGLANNTVNLRIWGRYLKVSGSEPCRIQEKHGSIHGNKKRHQNMEGSTSFNI